MAHSGIWILALLLGASANLSKAGEIYRICAGARRLDRTENIAALTDSVCRLRDAHAGQSAVAESTKSILAILKKVEGDPARLKAWSEDSELFTSMNELSEVLTEQAGPRPKLSGRTPLSMALANLLNRFSSRNDREKRPEEYRKKLDAVLAQTKTGKAVLDCYFGKQSSDRFDVSPTFVYENGGPDFKMGLQFDSDRRFPRKTLRIMHFNPSLDPIDALIGYAHEMKHGCHAAEQMKHIDAVSEADNAATSAKRLPLELIRKGGLFTRGWVKRLESRIAALDQSKRARDQFRVVDETRAYEISYRVFEEIVGSDPSHLCNRATVSLIFGGQVMKLGELFGAIQDKFENDSFPVFLARDYTEHAGLAAHNIFRRTGSRELRPELKQQLRNAGYRVHQD